MSKDRIVRTLLVVTFVLFALPAAALAGTHQLLVLSDTSSDTSAPVSDHSMITITSNADKGGNDATSTTVSVGGSVVPADVVDVCAWYGGTKVNCATSPSSLSGIVIDLLADNGQKGGSTWEFTISLNSSAAGKTFNLTVTSITGTDNATLPATTATRNATAGCSKVAPTVSITPTLQTISTDGGSVNYTVSITNNDSGAGCTDTTFSLTAVDTDTAPGTNFVTPSSLVPGSVVLAAGANTSVTLTVTARTGVTSATNDTYVTATEGTHPTGTSNTVTTTISVAAGCTAAAPTVSVSPTAQTITSDGGNVTYDVVVTNNDSGGGCTSSTFNLNPVDSDGGTNFVVPSGISPGSVVLAPGADNSASPATLTVTAQAGITSGTNNTYVEASDSVNHSGQTGTSNTVTTTISVGPVGGDGNLLRRSVEETCHSCHKTDKNAPADPDAIKMHNSTNLSSTYWSGDGGWGVAGGKYGEFGCTTCHTAHSTKNIYLINETITTPDGSNWTSTGSSSLSVDFRELAGTTSPYTYAMGNDADNHTTSVRICEVCHTQTLYHRYDTTGQTAENKDHKNAADCTGCHDHRKSFLGDCGDCHGRPPVDASTVISSPEATQRDGQNGWNGWGAHPTHNDYGFTSCTVCHNGGAEADPEHSVVPLQLTMGFTHVATGGTYSAPAFPNTNFTLESDGTTTISYPSGSVRQCSGIYCHSNGRGSFNSSPEWDTASTGACGTCHVNNHTWDAAKNMSPSHQDHIGSTPGYQFNCSKCHNTIVSDTDNSSLVPTILDKSEHVNGTTTAILKTGDSLVGASADYNTTDNICSSVYCHSDGLASPTYATPDWDVNTSGDCGTCHGVNDITPPSSDNHDRHVTTTTGYKFECQKCHDTIVTATADSTEIPVIDDASEHVNGTPKAILDTLDSLVGASAVYNLTENTCTSVYCHGNGMSSNGDGTSDGTSMTPDWDSTTYITGQSWDTYCNRCHGFPPKGYDGSHELMTANDGSGCSGCHDHLNSGTDASESGWGSCCSTSGPFNDLTLHVNGDVDGGDCIACHTLGGPGNTGPNNRRPVADEFGYQNANGYGSHHVVGVVELKTQHCGVCHGEGSYVDGKTTAKHQDGIIDLRDVDTTDSYFPYVGSAGPVTNADILNLDSHCLSCHDGNGSNQVWINKGAGDATEGSNQNPFNDSLSNEYDQKVRSAVVNVFDQFDPGTGGTGDGNYNGNYSQHAVRGQRYGANILSVAGLMTGNPLLKTGQTAVDSAVLSCGDCHTSGDTAIGIHGSKNEYLLRVTNGAQTDYGTDALHTYTGAATDTLVCYYCHTVGNYMDSDNGTHAGSDSDFVSSIGEIGSARFSDKSYKQIFGYPCAHCHNAGSPTIGLEFFGGIHGQASTIYTAGSGNSTQNRRFMPGVSNDKYDGGDWTLSTSAGNSCYTSGSQLEFTDCAKHGGTKATSHGERHIGRAIEY